MSGQEKKQATKTKRPVGRPRKYPKPPEPKKPQGRPRSIEATRKKLPQLTSVDLQGGREPGTLAKTHKTLLETLRREFGYDPNLSILELQNLIKPLLAEYWVRIMANQHGKGDRKFFMEMANMVKDVAVNYIKRTSPQLKSQQAEDGGRQVTINVLSGATQILDSSPQQIDEAEITDINTAHTN